VNEDLNNTKSGKARLFQVYSQVRTMNSRLASLREFSRPRRSLSAVMTKAPWAEAFAASWLTRLRPALARVYTSRRRVATIAVAVLTLSLFVHVMFGANGMVVYRQKRAEYNVLQKQIADVQRDNDSYTKQIQGLQSDEKAIEKEAREQFGYVRPGEYVYVAPAPAKPAPPPVNHSAKK
jgi:cell division protein FtsB